MAETQPISGPSQSITKTESAYRTLRHWIEIGRLAPGFYLRVGQLTEELDMSPTPIREALRLLQSDGLIANEPHRGSRVVEYRLETVQETYEIRVVLEPLAARLAAQRASSEQLGEIEGIHRRLKEAVRSGSPAADAVALNAAWHRAIFRAAGSNTLADLIDRLWASASPQAMWISSRARQSVAEHERVVAAIRARQPALAASSMRDHVDNGRRRYVQRLRVAATAVEGLPD